MLPWQIAVFWQNIEVKPFFLLLLREHHFSTQIILWKGKINNAEIGGNS